MISSAMGSNLRHSRHSSWASRSASAASCHSTDTIGVLHPACHPPPQDFGSCFIRGVCLAARIKAREYDLLFLQIRDLMDLFISGRGARRIKHNGLTTNEADPADPFPHSLVKGLLQVLQVLDQLSLTHVRHPFLSSSSPTFHPVVVSWSIIAPEYIGSRYLCTERRVAQDAQRPGSVPGANIFCLT